MPSCIRSPQRARSAAFNRPGCHGVHMPRYESHGLHSAQIADQVITSTLSGSFNREGCLAWVTRLKALIEGLDGRPFCLLIDTRDYEGGTDEALQLANEFNRWLNSQPLVAKAHLITSQVLHAIAVERVPQLKYQTIKTFKCIDEAQVWLASQLAHAQGACTAGEAGGNPPNSPGQSTTPHDTDMAITQSG